MHLSAFVKGRVSQGHLLRNRRKDVAVADGVSRTVTSGALVAKMRVPASATQYTTRLYPYKYPSISVAKLFAWFQLCSSADHAGRTCTCR